MGCIFCKIVAGAEPCHRIWEDEEHLAFLTIYPNTLGASVVITKEHCTSYAFDLSEDRLTRLVLAAKKVGKLLDERLPGVGRTGLVLEGFGVDHAHAKLFPMHGTGGMKVWTPILSTVKTVFTKYEGYLCSNGGPRADDAELAKLAALIRGKP